MDKQIQNNYEKLKLSLFFLPFILLSFIAFILFKQSALNTDSYIQVQKEWFYYLNNKLSAFPLTEYNLTQFGDALIALSFLAIFIVKAPKIWESLISATIISGILSKVLKTIFSVPRPAAILDHHTFVIIGKPLLGQTNSLPSGHSITVFTVLTVIMFSFIPKKAIIKVFWYLSIIFIGIILASTRIGIGAHFPLDVLIGCIIGYISGISGIFINLKYPIWTWINNKKFYPIFILLFAIAMAFIVTKIRIENLIIYYLSFISLAVSSYIIIKDYVKK
ncbi:phosphatase PAP2 family protein [Daejeonella sp.]|uniref:phosphatase PAP2 family protein n=1 Tax=Daejeonella sp. TaxID=2805397 RepID=UPI0025BCC2B1|nr:phosphatase PAP2 family protein [Daejeonella sp.]